jgi:exosortase A
MMSMTLTPPRLRDAWRAPLIAFTLLLLAILLLYWDTGAAMVRIWMRSETFTHAFVVPPIVAWLIWRKRGELAPLQPAPSLWALLLMTGAAVLWWLGDLVNVAAATQFALAAMIVTCVPLVLGWRVAVTLAFPLAFLFFAVPIGEFMTPTLMHWTAEVLVASLRLTGIPVYQEGQQLVIPSGRWAVVEACSGIRYLMATFMVGSLFAYLNYQGTRKRLIFVAISLALPVLANWVRAYIIVMLGHLSGNKIATGVDHLVYGWVFFGIVILALFFVGARWADPDDADELELAAIRQAAMRSDQPVASWRPVLLAVVAVVFIAMPNLGRLQDGAADALTPVRIQLPAALGSWQAAPEPSQQWTPHFPKATTRLAQGYRSPAGEVAVHIAYYRGQRADVKLVSSVNGFVADDQPWHILSRGVASTTADGKPVGWRSAVLTASDGSADSSRQRLTVWRVYWLGGRLARGDVEAKMIQAWQAVLGESDDGAAIHLVSATPDGLGAEQQLAAFVNENFAMLERALAAAKASR